jgi:PRTRC genetic system protein E
VSACPGAIGILRYRSHCTWNIKEENVFVELMPLLKDRTLLLTIAGVDGKVKVNVIPVKAKEAEDQALTTPLSYAASPEELDAEFGKHLASYVDAHLSLGSTLAEAKAEMDAAAKAARQKAKAAQVPKTEAASAKKAEPTTSTAVTADPTPSLFSAEPQSTQPPVSAPEEERETS